MINTEVRILFIVGQRVAYKFKIGLSELDQQNFPPEIFQIDRFKFLQKSKGKSLSVNKT